MDFIASSDEMSESGHRIINLTAEKEGKFTPWCLFQAEVGTRGLMISPPRWSLMVSALPGTALPFILFLARMF